MENSYHQQQFDREQVSAEREITNLIDKYYATFGEAPSCLYVPRDHSYAAAYAMYAISIGLQFILSKEQKTLKLS